jgi:hypothetical protein
MSNGGDRGAVAAPDDTAQEHAMLNHPSLTDVLVRDRHSDMIAVVRRRRLVHAAQQADAAPHRVRRPSRRT